MSYLSFIEKETIFRLFGIEDGFVFKYWSDQGTYNKTKTKELILEACGINIFDDPNFKGLSQEKCIKKIGDERSPLEIAKLLQTLCDYFSFRMGDAYWSTEDSYDFAKVQETIKRLKSLESVVPPLEQIPEDLSAIMEDITNNLVNQKPELAVDRLHTFSCEYLRKLCSTHGITIVDANGKHLPLHSLAGSLKKWYEENQYCDTGFALIAIRNSISLFDSFNQVRNDHSAAHPNHLLSKAEAEYVVRTMLCTLSFFEQIEKNHAQEQLPPSLEYYLTDPPPELPF